MITKFLDFLNENNADDIKKRILQNIDDAFRKIKSGDVNSNPVPIKSETSPVIGGVTGGGSGKVDKEPKFKSKPSMFGDKRLDDAYLGLVGLYGDKATKDYLNDIDLEPDDSTESIVRYGMKYLSKVR
jgi:hypothetical protein